MIRICGMYNGQFVWGEYAITDGSDMVALRVLRDGFVGAIWGADAAVRRAELRRIDGGKR